MNETAGATGSEPKPAREARSRRRPPRRSDVRRVNQIHKETRKRQREQARAHYGARCVVCKSREQLATYPVEIKTALDKFRELGVEVKIRTGYVNRTLEKLGWPPGWNTMCSSCQLGRLERNRRENPTQPK